MPTLLLLLLMRLFSSSSPMLEARGKGGASPQSFLFPKMPLRFSSISVMSPSFCQQQIQSLDSSLAFWSSLFEFFLNNVVLNIFFHPTFVQKSIK